jgi:hypothetical protein
MEEFTIRYKTNPFLGDLVVTKKSKQVKISPLGKDNNILINQETGEVSGTHVVTYKRYDDAKFLKVFPAMIAAQFDLTSPGMKTFSVLMYAVQEQAMSKDLVLMDSVTLEEFVAKHDLKLSLATFKRGLTDLEKNKFIAKAQRKGYYYINPSLMFNGDRIAFTTVIQRDNSVQSEDLFID